MKNNEDLLKLLDRIACGEATDEEISEYNRWCQAFQEKGLPLSEMEKITSGMLVKIRQQIHRNFRIRRLRLWTKVAAAACILLVLALGSYHLIYKPQTEPIARRQVTNDEAPGGNKAILTLANGHTIILDSVHTGQIAKQGNSKITKINSGLLTYNPHAGGRSGVVSVSYNTLSIPRGGQYQLVLPDGTKVWLNAASSIRFPTAFTGRERKVAITGEVYMEVAEDAGHPFIVTTRNSAITVLGTHFNIMAYDNEPAVKTTLLEGAVKISVPGKQAATILKPGQQASVTNHNGDISVKKVNAAGVAAWIHGLLSLRDCSVQEFMNQLSRWYNVDIEYAGKVPQQRFGGLINRNASLSDVLSALGTAGIHTKLEKNKIIVLSQ